MRERWSRAPGWLQVLSVLGVPWFVTFVALGAPLLLTEGPGLPLIWIGCLGLVPAVIVLVGRPT